MEENERIRILSWNINGLRSYKPQLQNLFLQLNASIICFQETKVTRDMLEEPLAIIEGYHSFFGFSRKRSGYSGVCTFSDIRSSPIEAQEGLTGQLPNVSQKKGLLNKNSSLVKGGERESLGEYWHEDDLKDLDSEGRCVMTMHQLQDQLSGTIHNLCIINVYCPRADPEREDRKIYKLKFYDLLWQRCVAIRKRKCHVMVVGDINTSHKRLDHCDDDPSMDFENRPDRKFLDNFILNHHLSHEPFATLDFEKESDILHNSYDCDANICHMNDQCDNEENSCKDEIGYIIRKQHCDFRMIDTFRYFHPHQKDAFTCWNSKTNARATNYGARIDYIFCNKEFVPFVNDSCVLQDVLGSDHCPVAVDLIKGIKIIPSDTLPSLCSKFFPEFFGNQQKLSSYFKQKEMAGIENTPETKHNSPIRKKPRTDSKSKSPVRKKPRTNSKPKQTSLNSFFNAKTTDIKIVFDTKSDDKAVSNSSGDISNKLSIKSQPDCLLQAYQESNGHIVRTTNIHCIGETLQPSLTESSLNNSIQLQTTQTSIASIGTSESSSNWNFMMKGPKIAPLCPGHREPSVLRVVKKRGPNFNRQFYACSRGVGREGDPNAQCKFFQWARK